VINLRPSLESRQDKQRHQTIEDVIKIVVMLGSFVTIAEAFNFANLEVVRNFTVAKLFIEEEDTKDWEHYPDNGDYN